MATVSGNVGGASGSGARVQLIPRRTQNAQTIAICDGSGNFSFSNIGNGEYVLRVDLAGFVIRQRYDIVVTNNTDVTALNFFISNINSAS